MAAGILKMRGVIESTADLDTAADICVDKLNQQRERLCRSDMAFFMSPVKYQDNG